MEDLIIFVKSITQRLCENSISKNETINLLIELSEKLDSQVRNQNQMIEGKIVYNVDFGIKAAGKVVEHDKCTFQCYETPLFGGDWVLCGEPFNTREEAIQYLNSLT